MDSLADVDEIARGRVGRTLREKWRLDALLGVGGMAAVYAGTHRNGKRGAVKVLHPELARSGDARARFLREGYVANAVDHPGAVAVIDDDATEDGLVFMVMELLQGSTLDALAEASPGRVLPLDVVLKAADDLLDVLAAAHANGIVHRDIKPENLFLVRDGALKVLDFGIARLKQGDGSVRATRTGDAMGTPAFMPPEQALGNWSEVDGRTDLSGRGRHDVVTLLSGRVRARGGDRAEGDARGHDARRAPARSGGAGAGGGLRGGEPRAREAAGPALPRRARHAGGDPLGQPRSRPQAAPQPCARRAATVSAREWPRRPRTGRSSWVGTSCTRARRRWIAACRGSRRRRR